MAEPREVLIALEVSNVNRQQVIHSVHVHTRCHPSVMYLHTFDVAYDKKLAPAIMHFAAVRLEIEIPLDHTSNAIGFGNRQPEPVLIHRAI